MCMIKKCFLGGIGLSSKLIQSNPALWTPAHYGHLIRQFSLSLGKESPYIFPKFKPLNTDIELLIQTADTFFLRNEQILI